MFFSRDAVINAPYALSSGAPLRFSRVTSWIKPKRFNPCADSGHDPAPNWIDTAFSPLASRASSTTAYPLPTPRRENTGTENKVIVALAIQVILWAETEDAAAAHVNRRSTSLGEH